jgi:hypothetical protein
MTQGVFVDGKRPASKKAVKEAIADDPRRVHLEATSFFGNEFDGLASEMPIDKMVFFVGPDPERKRNFYGNIVRKADGRIKVE